MEMEKRVVISWRMDGWRASIVAESLLFFGIARGVVHVRERKLTLKEYIDNVKTG
jgi:hypothetical protein